MTKKTIIQIALPILILLSTMASTAQIPNTDLQNPIYYTVADDSCAYVKGVNPFYRGDIVIPATWQSTNGNRYDVAGILYIGKPNITSVSYSGSRNLKIKLDALQGNQTLKYVNISIGSLLIDSLNNYQTNRNPFLGCTALNSVNGDATVVLPGEGVISYCIGNPAKSITLSKDKYGTSVRESAFEGACNLEEINLPDVTLIESRAFKDCTSLTSISIPKVRQLYPGTFQGCTALKSFTLPEDMTVLQGETFDGCSSLESITFPELFHCIAYRAFRGCTSLKHISLPPTIAVIYVQAFKNCSGLTEITLPTDLEEFGPEVFTGCTALRTVTAPMPTPFEADENVFDEATYNTAILYVPTGTRDAYASTLPWRRFKNIIERDL